MGGHVFITRGDLTKLACDAWLLPTDSLISVTTGFRSGLPSGLKEHLKRLHLRRLKDGSASRSPAQFADEPRVLAVSEGIDATRDPRPYLVNIGGSHGRGVGWYVSGVVEFLRVSAESFADREPLHGRAKPLIGLPLVGTGHGGGAKAKGEIVTALLPAFYEAAAAYDVDVVLVTADQPAFAAAQHARKSYLHAQPPGEAAGWSELDKRLRDSASPLVEHAKSGSLVLFLGAGVSQGAGVPTWGQLLDDLAREAEMKSDERRALHTLDIRDQARIVRSRLEGRAQPHQRANALGKAVARHTDALRYSLTHSLLACLPVSEVVTTNYDRLFEMASDTVGYDTRVLPYQRAPRKGRWLLKLHGSIDHPEDIVLTREDYLRYDDRRGALAGIVQALLITRHMLFVGFSLTDDNFHRIVDDVRKASRGSDEQGSVNSPFGTALLLHQNALLEELWRDELNHVAMTTSPTSPADASHTTAAGDGGATHQDIEAARRLEIFLDYLLAEASPASLPMLNPDYGGILSLEEREIRELLLSIERKAAVNQEAVRAWPRIKELLADLGSTTAATGNDASPAKTP